MPTNSCFSFSNCSTFWFCFFILLNKSFCLSSKPWDSFFCYRYSKRIELSLLIRFFCVLENIFVFQISMTTEETWTARNPFQWYQDCKISGSELILSSWMKACPCRLFANTLYKECDSYNNVNAITQLNCSYENTAQPVPIPWSSIARGRGHFSWIGNFKLPLPTP